MFPVHHKKLPITNENVMNKPLNLEKDCSVQQSLFEGEPLKKQKVVNVASVKQLSLFRYPGGKTWLVPEVRKWLTTKKEKPSEFVEPFAGGGIIGLTVANEFLADRVTMVELDPDVASVWHTILSKDAEWLAKQILEFDLTLQNAMKILESKPRDTRERAFQTIIKNRVYHGGILAPGSGLLKSGENGRGIASRWYPETLAKRIKKIMTFRDRISFIEGDGVQHIKKTAQGRNTVYFIDPPYTAPGKRAGTRLYKFSEIDHENLFNITSKVSGDFMMTYDNAGSVIEMAKRRSLHMRKVPMKGNHHTELYELLITPS